MDNFNEQTNTNNDFTATLNYVNEMVDGNAYLGNLCSEFMDVQDKYMAHCGYEEETLKLRGGDDTAFNNVDKKQLASHVMHMYNGMLRAFRFHYRLDVVRAFYAEVCNMNLARASWNLPNEELQEILEIEYDEALSDYASELFVNFAYKHSRREVRWIMAYDSLIRESKLFANMWSLDKLIIKTGLICNRYDTAPIHSTMYLRNRFSAYANIANGKASVSDWWHTYWNGKEDLKDEAIDAGLAYGLYRESPTLTTAFLLLLQRIHKYFNTSIILRDIIDFAKRMIQALKDNTATAFTKMSAYINPRHHTQGVAESIDQVDSPGAGAPISSTNNTLLDDTSLRIGSFIDENGESASTIVSLFVSIVFVCIATSLGMSAFVKDASTSFLKKIGNVGLSFSGVSRGIDGLINLASKFESLVQHCIAYFLGKSENHKLLSAVMQSGVEDHDGFEKIKYVEYAIFLMDPKNIHTIHASDEWKFKLEKCDEIANILLTKIASGEMSLARDSVAWFGHVRNEIKKVRQGIHRYPKVEPQRFVPYWINVAGEPGVGKSVMIGDLSVYLSKCLYKGGKYGFKSVPEDDIFNKNFADKYMPGYRGQNIVTIDDVFQDASVGSVELSSAIQLINYVSSVPYQPVQASLDEKGMPFTSKLVLTSTNSEVPNRMEITCQGALLTRIRKMIRITWHPKVCGPCKTARGVKLCDKCLDYADPSTGRPIRYTILRLNTTGVMAWEEQETVSWKELRLTILKDFLSYWNHQQNMLTRANHVELDDESDDILNQFSGKASIHSTGVISMLRAGMDGLKNGTVEFVYTRPKTGWEAFQRAKGYDALFNELCKDMLILNVVSMYCASDEELMATSIEMERGEDTIGIWQLRENDSKYKSANEWIAKFNVLLKKHAMEQPDGHYGLNVHDVLSTMYNKYMVEREMMHKASSEALMQMWDQWKSSIIGSVLGTIMAVFVGLIGFKAVKAVKDRFAPGGPVSTNIRYNNGPNRVRPSQLKASIHSTNFVSDDVDITAVNLLASMEQHDSMCRIKIWNGDEIWEANGIRVCGPFILMNAHHVDGVEDGSLMEITIPSRDGWMTVKQCFDVDRIRRFDCGREIDAVLYECDNKMRHAKNIVHHFLDEEVDFVSTPAMLYTAGVGDSSVSYIYNDIIATPVKWNYEHYVAANNQSYSVLGFYQINTSVPRGMSGSLLMANNTRMSRKIMGIQVASANGGKKYSYVQPITEAMLKKTIGDTRIISEPEIAQIHSCCNVTEMGQPPENLAWDGIKYLGLIPRSHQMTMAGKTKYRESVIHEPETVTQEPSVLSNFDRRMKTELIGRSVMFRNLEKFDKPCGLVRNAILSMVTVWLAAWYATKQRLPGIRARLLNDYEMVNGCEPLMKQFDMRTSPGFPYVKNRTVTDGRGKFEWFTERVLDDGKKVYDMKDEVQKQIEYREQQAKEGNRVPTIAYACLKDETRPIEKIEAGKTRVFLCMPMDYNLLVRKYFGAFIMMMHARAGLHISSCVGVDPCVGWTALARRLKSVGSHAEDFDYGGWDTQIHPRFMEAFVEIVNAWYGDGEDNALVRKTLIYELSHTFFIAQDRLFQKSSGTCSGFALTAECNSIINELIMVYSWAILAARHDEEMCNLQSFMDHCALGVYGDDIVKTVSNSALWFNGNNIKPIVDELGMEITTGNKDGTDFQFTDLENLTFLKRSFRPVGYGAYTAPLRKDIIENIPQWIHKSDDPAYATNVNVMTAARHYALWGKMDYDKFCSEINLRIADKIGEGYVDLAPVCVTHKEMMNAIYKDNSMIL